MSMDNPNSLLYLPFAVDTSNGSKLKVFANVSSSIASKAASQLSSYGSTKMFYAVSNDYVAGVVLYDMNGTPPSKIYLDSDKIGFFMEDRTAYSETPDMSKEYCALNTKDVLSKY